MWWRAAGSEHARLGSGRVGSAKAAAGRQRAGGGAAQRHLAATVQRQEVGLGPSLDVLAAEEGVHELPRVEGHVQVHVDARAMEQSLRAGSQ